ncbi:MAG: prepilin-type N-terminal cleavage/methylation domain-containing protein [Gemmatimonadales bacterium]|nr:prepilin-type N-terminal cleavage/methylation domain-containing protein [Gemmatimonadales bacterium]NIN12355.1 prepilin-type N-terminal cleavage/methylation domain-containing protein [Gemmatimonadales bacterium]NIN48893.1 prepilin-type N-terminal cleavage/methylation domain-containing protein [Gemmatimonadales bacterium]NIP06357.1 prepilin-type N-terminal cleavage/methylation domain-containing protein [Gemmatimonadales bacterium]NIR00730.1 prepilin-type N-terminal cleavage/methylation domain
MRPVGERGFTLIELLVVVIVSSVILAAIYQTIGSTQRITGTQVQRVHVQQNTRAATLFLTYALRELDATDNDIAAVSDTALRIRGVRWAGVLCTDPVDVGGDVGFVLRNSMHFGIRQPNSTLDSILLFRDGDPTLRTQRADDRWLVGALQSTTDGTCPDGTGGKVVTVRISAASGGRDSTVGFVTAGAPIRGFQMEEISLYQSGGEAWLGRRSADRGGGWSEWQLLVGPLTADGMAFAYYDTTGAVTATLADIASVGLVVRGRSPARAYLSTGGIGYVQDSVITRVTLRNNRGF